MWLFLPKTAPKRVRLAFGVLAAGEMGSLANFFLRPVDARRADDVMRPVRGSGTAPSARESHACVTLGANVYVFGGFDGMRVLNDLYVFDVHTSAWTQVVHSGIAPPARAGATACALGVPPHIVVFGGANSTRRFADVQLLDTASNTWTKPAAHGQPPIARYYHTACFVKGSMLVFGGNDGSACLGDLHVLNVETWTWSQPETSGATPAARCGHSGTLVNKLWFVIGGVGDAPNNAFNALELNDVWVLDTEAWAWWRPDVNPVLPPLAYHTAALTGDKIFLFGGSSKDMLYNDVMMLDTTSSAWKVVQEGAAAKLPCRRRHSASRGSGTRILVFGGWDGARTCGELLELETSDWIRSDNVPRGRAPPKPTVNDGTGGGGGGGTLVLSGNGTPAAAAATRGGGGGSVGVDTSARGGFASAAGGRTTDEARERWEASTADEIKKLRGELARLKMSNEVLTKELHKMKTLVGAANPAADGAGVDVDALASKRELESIRVELSKLRRQGSQDHEALRLEVQQIKRALAVQEAMAAAE